MQFSENDLTLTGQISPIAQKICRYLVLIKSHYCTSKAQVVPILSPFSYSKSLQYFGPIAELYPTEV